MFKNSGILVLSTAVIWFATGCSFDTGSASNPPDATWTEGVYKPMSTFANYCGDPRVGLRYSDKLGTSMHEKMWLRSMTHELYLWNDEVEDVDPAVYFPKDYFALLKVPYPKDRFHWAQDTETYNQGSQSGIYFGYGITWDIIAHPHVLGVQSIEANAGVPNTLQRGDVLLAADGVYIEEVEDGGQSVIPDKVYDALFPQTVGESHVFTLSDRDTGQEKELTLVAGKVSYKSVPIVKPIVTESGNVAYLQFNRHNTIAENELFEAFSGLENENITDLVLDLRYNGGGYISIASELAYMIAGPNRTDGKVFFAPIYNKDIGTTNPFTGEVNESIPFYQVNSKSVSLPTLNLDRVFVLTSAQTCSASEAVMNGLAGVGVEVIQIGETTCGKPYAYYPMDNCGTTYFTIMSKNVNALGYGDYYTGFSADPFTFDAPEIFQGCVVADDFKHDLGAEDESMLAVALAFRSTGVCSNVQVAAKAQAKPEREQLKTLLRQQSTLPFAIMAK